MIKYYNSMVVFEEIPNEITLAINITNCPCHCKGCHSKFLWEDIGTELTFEELDRLIAYGIVPENKDRIINYQNSSKVYKNLRQHYK